MKTVKVILSFFACFIAIICYVTGLGLGFIGNLPYGVYLSPVFAALLVLLARKLWNRKRSFWDMGLSWRGHRWDLPVGMLLGAVLILLGFLTIWSTGDIQVSRSSFLPGTAGLLMLEFFLGAAAEEICFREVVLSTLMEAMNRYLALFFSAVLFSLLHFFNPDYSPASFVGIFLAGLLLGAAFIFTRNIWFSVGLHFSWNLIQSLVGFSVSGGVFSSVLELSYPKGYSLWNGGAFGFEASLPCFVLLILTTVLVLSYYSKHTYKSFEHEKTDFSFLD